MSLYKYASIGGASCAAKGVAGHEPPAAIEAKAKFTGTWATPIRGSRSSPLLSGCASSDGGCPTPSRSLPRFTTRTSKQIENRSATLPLGAVADRSFAKAFRVSLNFIRQPVQAISRPGATAAGQKRYRHSPGQHRMGRTPAICILLSPLRRALPNSHCAHLGPRRSGVAACLRKQKGRRV